MAQARDPGTVILFYAIRVCYWHQLSLDQAQDCAMDCVVRCLEDPEQRADWQSPPGMARRRASAPYTLTPAAMRIIAIVVRTYERQRHVGLYREGISLSDIESAALGSNCAQVRAERILYEIALQSESLEEATIRRCDCAGKLLAITEAIRKLPERSREIFERFYDQDQSIADISLATDCSQAAVKKTLERCRNRIRESVRRQEHPLQEEAHPAPTGESEK